MLNSLNIVPRFNRVTFAIEEKDEFVILSRAACDMSYSTVVWHRADYANHPGPYVIAEMKFHTLNLVCSTARAKCGQVKSELRLTCLASVRSNVCKPCQLLEALTAGVSFQT